MSAIDTTKKTSMYQPATTDTSMSGHRRARNAMRLMLWADDIFAHSWLVHDGNSKACPDGCNHAASAGRKALYQSEIEP